MTTALARQTETTAGSPALIGVAGVVFEALTAGALWWPDERLLLVADLHLEKGSAYATRGQMLPPYDTAETLKRLTQLVAALDPGTVVALGDSFHDDGGPERMAARDRDALRVLQTGRSWTWIAGNHDRNAPMGLGGDFLAELAIGPLQLRHEPGDARTRGEIAGHLHPAARVAGRGRSVRRRCFVGDGERLVMPAFGAYAGGLNILDRAFRPLFAERGFQAWILGDERVHAVSRRTLRRD